MCGIPWEVVRIVACRPPGVPTVCAWAASAGPLAASARAASASQQRETYDDDAGIDPAPHCSPCSDADDWTRSYYPAGALLNRRLLKVGQADHRTGNECIP